MWDTDLPEINVEMPHRAGMVGTHGSGLILMHLGSPDLYTRKGNMLYSGYLTLKL